MDQVNDATVLSKIDLKDAHYRIKIKRSAPATVISNTW
jgi:hypothetical protein